MSDDTPQNSKLQYFIKNLTDTVTTGTDGPAIEIDRPYLPQVGRPEAIERRYYDVPFAPMSISSKWLVLKTTHSFHRETGIDSLEFEGILELPFYVGETMQLEIFGVEMHYCSRGMDILKNLGMIYCDRFPGGELPIKMQKILGYGREEDRLSPARSAIFIVLVVRYLQSTIIPKLQKGEVEDIFPKV